jgi:hypothetical protein
MSSNGCVREAGASHVGQRPIHAAIRSVSAGHPKVRTHQPGEPEVGVEVCLCREMNLPGDFRVVGLPVPGRGEGLSGSFEWLPGADKSAHRELVVAI